MLVIDITIGGTTAPTKAPKPIPTFKPCISKPIYSNITK